MTISDTRRPSGYRIISTIMVCFFIFGAIIIGGGAGFLNVPALMITCGTTFFLLLGVYRKDFLTFIPDSIATFFTVSPMPNPVFADIAKTGSRFIIGTGVVGTLIGFIQILRNLSDPSAIGAGMAVALLTSLYAILIAEIYFAFLYKVYSRPPARPEKECSTLPIKNLGIPVLLITWIVCTFFIVMFVTSNDDNSELRSDPESLNISQR